MRFYAESTSHLYDTYGLISPKQTHTRVATCAEVECEAHIHGWVTKVDVGTEIGVQRARYIIDHSGRTWTSKQEGGLVTFTFPASQECFREHRVTLNREPIYTVMHGDHRQTRDGVASPVGSDEWVDRFANNQINLEELFKRG